MINIFQMQRDPTIFKEPLQFKPERFETTSAESKNAFSFLAFSAGPRNCIDVGELKLKQGTSVMINIFQMQRDPTIFKEPLQFKPERFETTSAESKNAFSFLAFSAGPRNCIGQRFAMLEMKATLSQLVRRFRLPPVDHEPELRADLILKSKNGIKVKFLRR